MTKTLAKAPFRADIVGSFLRPQSLKEARKQYQEGQISKEDLRAVEDLEIARLVEKQKELGLQVVTDGEFRRKYWHADFIGALEGIRTVEVEVPGFFQGEMQKLTSYTVASPLKFPEDHPFLADFHYLREIAGDHTAKLTIPGPNMVFHSGVVNSQIYADNPSYPSIDAVAKDISKVYQDAIQAFYDAGCRYLQLDDTSWGAFFSQESREKIEAKGWNVDELMEKFADITIDAIAHKPNDMVITMHVCRGNFKSAWLYEGDYEAVAKHLFSRVNVDAFFLEFDNERSGDFEPLRFIKKQNVVLGLITTKTAELEDPEEIKKRVAEAAEYVDLDHLCLSPQCGFASTEEGNLITEEEQWAKVRHVVEIAHDIWEE
ncbi:5-methyltetrahydropteroyltriglutamate--homocysteine S-methyltransferase [Lederbergia sp. NSJ-179]|uniref:5-methyltetrahydropteroyltriglutamate-- homocysteine S-methyltransferase n=1 Tax=Lederbergia sp. NSJ-179 TaxID=2931402 RepID=UPI001FD4BD5C|nr:5-methyltetrahydropteroyltriglutamate--homocysteine S-methyltransferase [Lederbergia sp. NSJ-179]MCJ7842988.1 5-methyltetrahydropteroyltriglutamate--homocysteine S-methyltransferase [Lederbergia sp. NSJ-179]